MKIILDAQDEKIIELESIIEKEGNPILAASVVAVTIKVGEHLETCIVNTHELRKAAEALDERTEEMKWQEM